jgi:hypothetical protein
MNRNEGPPRPRFGVARVARRVVGHIPGMLLRELQSLLAIEVPRALLICTQTQLASGSRQPFVL